MAEPSPTPCIQPPSCIALLLMDQCPLWRGGATSWHQRSSTTPSAGGSIEEVWPIQRWDESTWQGPPTCSLIIIICIVQVSPLNLACQHRKTEFAVRLLRAGASPNLPAKGSFDGKLYTPLYHAAYPSTADVELCRALIGAGATVGLGRSPLELKSQMEPEVVKIVTGIHIVRLIHSSCWFLISFGLLKSWFIPLSLTWWRYTFEMSTYHQSYYESSFVEISDEIWGGEDHHRCPYRQTTQSQLLISS